MEEISPGGRSFIDDEGGNSIVLETRSAKCTLYAWKRLNLSATLRRLTGHILCEERRETMGVVDCLVWWVDGGRRPWVGRWLSGRVMSIITSRRCSTVLCRSESHSPFQRGFEGQVMSGFMEAVVAQDEPSKTR